MFKLLMTYHNFKKLSSEFIITYLNRKKYLPKQISLDVMDSFSNNNIMFRMYMRNSPIGEQDIERLIQSRRNEYTPVNEVDLHHIYDITLDYLQVKFAFCRSVSIITYNVNGNKYFEVHKKQGGIMKWK